MNEQEIREEEGSRDQKLDEIERVKSERRE
jgi:hypothetical protein